MYPPLGASPDGVTNCDCCGNALSEIKCPYLMKYMHPGDITSAMCSFITDAGSLNQKHRYYTHVQEQLMITNRVFYDIVMWTKKGFVRNTS